MSTLTVNSIVGLSGGTPNLPNGETTPSVDTATAAVLNIGATNATSVTVGKAGVRAVFPAIPTIPTTQPTLSTDAISLASLQLFLATAPLNYIGIPGQAGFGVGIAPVLPTGMLAIVGNFSPLSDNYGNYVYSDGSIMVWIPAFFYKYGTGANGLAINVVDIKPRSAYATVAAANAAGYALHRAFYNNNLEKDGFFVDKYLASKNGTVASSIKLGNPLSTAADHNPIGGLTGTPTNTYGGCIAAARTRGATFFPKTIFQHYALAMLSLAHAEASTSTAFNAWYDSAGIINFPKGCNNNALKDVNDITVTFTTDGYSNCGKTGSGSNLAKTAHNGQNCGVVDLNGDMWEIAIGLTSNGTNFYLLNVAADVTTLIDTSAGATSAFGANTTLFTSLGTSYGAMAGGSVNRVYGSTSQVLSEATTGTAWNAAGAGIPLAGAVGGTNLFGNDYFYDAKLADLCPIVSGNWSNATSAGVWALDLNGTRSISGGSIGFRAALYL